MTDYFDEGINIIHSEEGEDAEHRDTQSAQAEAPARSVVVDLN